MTKRILVTYDPDADAAYRFLVAAESMGELAKLLGVPADQLGPMNLARRKEDRRNTSETRRDG